MKLSNLSIQSATQANGSHSRPNLSHEVLSSAKIGQILPVFFQECVPGDTFDVKHSMFCRTEPLSVPSYVTLNYRTMAVFVPYHQVCSGVESYMANMSSIRGKGNRIAVVSDYSFKTFFETNTIAVTTGASATDYDIRINTTSQYGNFQYRKLTPLGVYAVKVLTMLGMPIGGAPIPFATSSAQGHLFNALPLLSFFHAYNSYLSYSPRYNSSTLSVQLESLLRVENPVVSGAQMAQMFASLLLTYEESFWTTLWQNAQASVGNMSANVKKSTNLNDITTDTNSVNYDSTKGVFTNSNLLDGLVEDDPNVSGRTEITAQQIRLLLKFDDFFRRSNFAGSKDIEKIYSQFGVKIDDYKTRFPYFLAESTRQVNIGDVTSTSDTLNEDATTGAVVGSYAGKAIGDGDLSFKYTSHDYGMLFVFAWFAPRPLYYQGIYKEWLRVDPFDFYTPQLDQNLAVAIPRCQFDNDQIPTERFKPFGYGMLYSDYLYHNDIIAGVFRRFKGYDAWHFGRDVDTDFEQNPIYAQADSLVYMPNTGTEFERIFNITDPDKMDTDTLYLTIHNHCESSRQMRDMTGKTGLMSGDVHISANGNQVN